MGSAFGEKTHTLTTGEMPVHNHAQDAHQHTTQGLLLDSGTGATYLAGQGDGNVVMYSGGSARWALSWYNGGWADWGAMGWAIGGRNNYAGTNWQAPYIQNAGGGAAHNVIQPTRAALLCIKI